MYARPALCQFVASESIQFRDGVPLDHLILDVVQIVDEGLWCFHIDAEHSLWEVVSVSEVGSYFAYQLWSASAFWSKDVDDRDGLDFCFAGPVAFG